MVSLEFRHIWVTEATSYFLGPRFLDLILSENLQKAVTEKKSVVNFLWASKHNSTCN